MENKEKNMEKASEKQKIENLSDTIVNVIDRLAGKKSDLKLSFEDLTLDAGPMKTRLNGAIVLDVIFAKEES
ncbi:MAG: hypothetical protein NWF00_03255 [Candidatus Bathyarchaeota archaeon]|nr:hypothetical protein [Candidatus Bathyarchaeota archaeon]